MRHFFVSPYGLVVLGLCNNEWLKASSVFELLKGPDDIQKARKIEISHFFNTFYAKSSTENDLNIFAQLLKKLLSNA